MERLAAVLPCIEVLKLKLDDRELGVAGQRQQDLADIETAFRHYCQERVAPIRLLDFSFQIRGVMRISNGGRKHCMLSWFDGRMEDTCEVEEFYGVEVYAASEVHFLDSLRNLHSGGRGSKELQVRDGSFIARKHEE
jgi:hypothetical protein